jgi:hypothetical protein
VITPFAWLIGSKFAGIGVLEPGRVEPAGRLQGADHAGNATRDAVERQIREQRVGKGDVEAVGNLAEVERDVVQKARALAVDAGARELEANAGVEQRVVALNAPVVPVVEKRHEMNRRGQAAAADLEHVVMGFEPLRAQELELPFPRFAPEAPRHRAVRSAIPSVRRHGMPRGGAELVLVRGPHRQQVVVEGQPSFDVAVEGQRPCSSTQTRRQMERIDDGACDTKMIVLPSSMNRFTVAMHRC